MGTADARSQVSHHHAYGQCKHDVRQPVSVQELSTSLGPGDWAVVAQCLTELDEADKVAELLMRLVDGCNGVGSDALLALQIAFDLFDDDVQACPPPCACDTCLRLRNFCFQAEVLPVPGAGSHGLQIVW